MTVPQYRMKRSVFLLKNSSEQLSQFLGKLKPGGRNSARK